MSNEIELVCGPFVKNINARVTGNEDDRLVFADIKFQASIPGMAMEQFLEGAAHLYVIDANGGTVPRFPGIENFSLKRKWENVDLQLAPDVSFFDDDNSIGIINHLTGGRVHKMSFSPFLNTAVLTFTYSVPMPGMDIGKLVDRVLNQQVGIYLYTVQQELKL